MAFLQSYQKLSLTKDAAKKNYLLPLLDQHFDLDICMIFKRDIPTQTHLQSNKANSGLNTALNITAKINPFSPKKVATKMHNFFLL